MPTVKDLKNYIRRLHPRLIACAFCEYGQRFPATDVSKYNMDELNEILSDWIDQQDIEFRKTWKEV